MNRKKVLTRGMLLTIFIGIGFVSTPFFGSLKPNKKADAALERINLSSLKPGELISFKHPKYGDLYNGYVWHVLMYRKQDGSIRAWDVPRKGEFYGMPNLQWWRPFHDCLNFGPTMKDGFIDEAKPITCHDDDLPSEWWRNVWMWDIDGNRLGGIVDNLQKTKGVMKGNIFVFGRNN